MLKHQKLTSDGHCSGSSMLGCNTSLNYQKRFMCLCVFRKSTKKFQQAEDESSQFLKKRRSSFDVVQQSHFQFTRGNFFYFFPKIFFPFFFEKERKSLHASTLLESFVGCYLFLRMIKVCVSKKIFSKRLTLCHYLY